MRYVTTDDCFAIRNHIKTALEIAGNNAAVVRAYTLKLFKTTVFGKIRTEFPRNVKRGQDVYVWRMVGAWVGGKKLGKYVQGVECVCIKKCTPCGFIGMNGERVQYPDIIGFTL